MMDSFQPHDEAQTKNRIQIEGETIESEMSVALGLQS